MTALREVAKLIFMKHVIYSFLSLGLLAACAGPNLPMPTGYAYTHEEYKVRPGQDAFDVGYEYSSEANDAALKPWHETASVMITQLEEKGILSPAAPVAISAPELNSAYLRSFQFALYEALRAKKYSVVKEAPVKLMFEGQPTSENKDISDLTLIVMDNEAHKEIGRLVGATEVPSYGYADSEDFIEPYAKPEYNL